MTEDLIDWLATVARDPLAFVLGAFPWGEPGTRLEKFTGPEEWQVKLLNRLKLGLVTTERAIQEATASGHGVGKSACVSWICLWAISTCPDTRGVITANTETQLKTKTWVELSKWYHLFIGREYFTLSATALYSKDPEHERTWRIDQVPWSERNTEAFAGLHNQGRRILVIFDEASAIPDVIWETTEGALTDADTQIIWCVFGNPTRNTGRFKECFPGGVHAKAWHTNQVDSRIISFTNKQQVANWIEAYGEDSDFVRIRVRGVFPRTGEMEFISASDVDESMIRNVEADPLAPLALGVDVARYGQNASVLFLRKGRDGRTLPRKVYRGLSTVDLAQRVQETYNEYRTDGIFIDGGGVGGGVVDNVRHSHLFCYDVQFGSKDDVGGSATGNDGERYANKRAAMWGALRAWLKVGALPLDGNLKAQLVGPTYTYNVRGEIQLESKEDMMRRGVESPDDADALALTFAYPLQPHAMAGGEGPLKPLVEFEYDPYEPKRMVA